MATKRWRGDAPAVAKVVDWAFAGTWETNDIVTITPTGSTKTVSVVTGSTTITTLIDTIVAALNALSTSAYPEFREVTWSRSSNSLRATAGTAGKPFFFTVSTTETGGGAADSQTIDGATSSTGTISTASSGPNDWSVAANWSDGAVPANTNEVDLIDSSVDILYGLDQNGVTLARLTRHASFTGKVGLADYNTDNTTSYYEYRQKELKINCTLLEVHESTAGRFRINCQAAQNTTVVYGTGDATDTNNGALQWRGTHASNLVEVIKGTVDIAMGSADAATLTLKMNYETQRETDAVVRCGAGVTLTAATKDGGEIHTYCPVVAGTQYAGEWHHYDGAFTSPLFYGGTLFYRSDDDMTSPIFAGDSLLDCSRDLSPREIISAELHESAKIKDPGATVTWTNGIDFVRRPIGDGIDLGRNINLAVTGA